MVNEMYVRNVLYHQSYFERPLGCSQARPETYALAQGNVFFGRVSGFQGYSQFAVRGSAEGRIFILVVSP